MPDKAHAARYCEIQPRYEAIGAVLREQFVISVSTNNPAGWSRSWRLSGSCHLLVSAAVRGVSDTAIVRGTSIGIYLVMNRRLIVTGF